MAIALYPAILDRGTEGYGVFFPDFPGCVSAGADLQEAALNAEEALNAHIAEMVHAGEEIPHPSRLDDIEVDPEVAEVARLLLRAELPGRAVRINITLDEGLIASIDRVAKNRSGFLADAAREALAARAREFA